MKKIIACTAAALCTISMTASAAVLEFKINNTTLNIQNDNGIITSQTLEAAPYTVNNRTVVPVRVISESFGADVAWNEADETVTIIKGDTSVILTIGKNTALVNSEATALDVAPFTENGRTMVPVRFITESLGYNVTYEEYLDSVLITDEPSAMTIAGSSVSRAEYKMLFDEITSSGYSDEEAASAAEDFFIEMYALANGNQEYDETTLNYMLNYDGYIANTGVEALETTYTHLMIKNCTAGNAYSNLSSTAEPVTDEVINDIYNSEYVTAKHILIMTIDLETGEYYTDDEKEKAKKLADDIKKRLDNGEDFDKLMHEYSQDTGLEYYPDGYTFTHGEMVAPFEEAALSLKEGEISVPIESDYGYHIIKKESLADITEDIKAEISELQKNTSAEAALQELIKNVQITRNEDVISSITGR